MTQAYHSGRGILGDMTDQPPRREVRASDAERTSVVDRLSRALASGRLSVAEFDERTAAACRAVTRAELMVLVDDLPGRLW